MNIFVGNNDVGKSNILKALNLFFNNETELGKTFNFETDFTYLYDKKLKKAKEINIALTIKVPETYKDEGEIIWEKAWRKEGILPNKEKIYKKKPKSDLSSRSRIITALKATKYRYVPAAKSNSFFRNLLGTLYNTMSVSLADSIEQPMNEFTTKLQEVTGSLSKDLKDSLGFNSLLTTPQNLRELFETLDFKTYYNLGVNCSLEYRGDGIKARHIPMILKYMAKQDMLTRNKGSVRIFTFWGYEEPENNLELSKSFELSEQLYDISKTIPVFITTHSPAFYLCGEKEGTSLFHVEQKNEDFETTINTVKDLNNVNENMGLMQLVSPFYKEVTEKINKLQKIINETPTTDITTIYVEGKTDKNYLIKAFELYDQRIFEMFNSEKLKIYTHEEFGGVNSVKDWVAAWCWIKNREKMIAMFDADSAGEKALCELRGNKYIMNFISKQKTVKLFKVPKTELLIEIWNKGIELKYSIEHLFSVDVWKKCSSCLDKKSGRELPKIKDLINNPEKGLLPSMREVIDEDIVDNYISLKIKDYNKLKFSKKIIKLSETDPDIFENFKPIVNNFAEFFKL